MCCVLILTSFLKFILAIYTRSLVHACAIMVLFLAIEVGYMHVLPAEVQAMTRESLQTCTVDHQRKKQVDTVLAKLCS